MTDRPPRYTSLRDYARLLRKQWIVIAAPVLVAVVAALAYSLHEPSSYDARAQVLIQDESQQLTLLGTPVAAAAAGGPAAIVAETASTPGLAARVRRAMPTRMPADALMGDVSLSVDAATGLLNVDAHGPAATFAAALANTYARTIAATTTASVTRRFAAAARALRGRLGQLNPASPADAGERATLQDEISRLEFLRATSTPGQVVHVALPPAAPASPKPARDAALGLLAGLLLGLIAAFVRDALDGRMRNPAEIAGELRLPVLGHVRRRALGAVVYPGSGGSRDAAADVETFRILRSNVELLLADRARQALVVTSALPEEGKSTVAASLALAAASAGRRTLLLEADLRRPSLAARLGIAPTPGLADYLAGHAEPDACLRAIPVAPAAEHHNGNGNGNRNGNGHPVAVAAHPNLVCVPAGRVGAGAAELLASHRMRELLADVTAVYDLVIIDTAPLLPIADTRSLLGEAGAVLLCVRSGRTTQEQVQAARETLARVAPEATGIVVTDVRSRPGITPHGLYAYGYASAEPPAA